MMEAMKKVFETIATAKVATSAHEARGLGFLSDSDRITMNRERVLSDAKARALELVRAGYEPPMPRTDIPAPGENLLAALKMGVHLMRQGDFITDYEVKLGGKIAEVLCGGNVTPGTPVSEQYILDLEREGFKSLCGEENAGTNSVHAEDGKDAEELTTGFKSTLDRRILDGRDWAADRFPQTRHSIVAAVQGGDPVKKSKAIEAISPPLTGSPSTSIFACAGNSIPAMHKI